MILDTNGISSMVVNGMMSDLEKLFYAKELMIYEAYSKGNIDNEEFFAELHALSEWYMKERDQQLGDKT